MGYRAEMFALIASCTSDSLEFPRLNDRYRIRGMHESLVRVTELDSPTHEVHQRIKHFFIYSRMCGGKVIFYLLLKLIVSCDIINVTILVLKEK